jgi:hypothetical protein
VILASVIGSCAPDLVPGNEIAEPNAPTATTCCYHRWNVTALPDGA